MIGNARIKKYPLATIMPYGPDEKTVTKLVAAAFHNERGDSTALESWVATNIAEDEAIARRIYEFLKANGVKTVVTATVVMGCPHEEGPDFPHGGDCPLCPFWKGKQGSGSSDSRWDRLKQVRVEKLGFHYRFWLP